MSETDDAPLWGIAEIERLFTDHFPQARYGTFFVVEEVSARYSRVRLLFSEDLLRPGGVIQGAQLMPFADVALFILVMGVYGERSVRASTTDLNMHFVRPAPPEDIIAECRLVRAGQRLMVGTCNLAPVSDPDTIVAVATGTYSVAKAGSA